MLSITVIEPNPLLRLGLLTLMATITSRDRVKGQDYRELFLGSPSSGQADLVLLAAHPDDRINPLIQAVHRTLNPKHLILLSETAKRPSSWIDLAGPVTGYVAKSASADSIVSAIRLMLGDTKKTGGEEDSPAHVAQPGLSTPRSGISAGSLVTNSPPESRGKEKEPFTGAHQEASMLGLSVRQYQVLIELARGNSIKVISRQLEISPATTKGYLEALYQRLGVHNRGAAVYAALAKGATMGLPKQPGEAQPQPSSAAPFTYERREQSTRDSR